MAELDTLLREPAARLILAFIAAMVLMRLVLPLVRAKSAVGRAILWFWHPDARDPRRGVSEELRRATLRNMDGTFIALLVVFLVVRPFVLSAYYIPSASMEPTLYGRAKGRQDRILAAKYIYWLRAPRRGEIVVFRAPFQATGSARAEDFIKRLVGLPGDTIEVRGNRVYLNGQRQDEPYLPANLSSGGILADMPATLVPPGHYFVLGDNRTNSADSRAWGMLPANLVHGRAVCVWWPLWAADPRDPTSRPHLVWHLLR